MKTVVEEAISGAAGFTFFWNFVARRQYLFVQRNAA
jgi:hypothetical protein